MGNISDIAGSAAKEMHEPVSIIQHHINLLISQIPEDAPPSVRASLDDLKRSAEQLASTVDKFSRAEAPQP